VGKDVAYAKYFITDKKAYWKSSTIRYVNRALVLKNLLPIKLRHGPRQLDSNSTRSWSQAWAFVFWNVIYCY